MAQFPLDPMLSKVILCAVDLKCVDDVIRYVRVLVFIDWHHESCNLSFVLHYPEFSLLSLLCSIVALLSVENIFVTSTKSKEKAAKAHQRFVSSDGDLMMLLNVYNGFLVRF
jgi:hypothetical protein